MCELQSNNDWQPYIGSKRPSVSDLRWAMAPQNQYQSVDGVITLVSHNETLVEYTTSAGNTHTTTLVQFLAWLAASSGPKLKPLVH